jgi:hypothetical protein
MVADYGLNGFEVLEVFGHDPTTEERVERIERNYYGKKWGPRSTTGYSGYEVKECEVL